MNICAFRLFLVYSSLWYVTDSMAIRKSGFSDTYKFSKPEDLYNFRGSELVSSDPELSLIGWIYIKIKPTMRRFMFKKVSLFFVDSYPS